MAQKSTSLETLARLSSKPGVQSTLVLSRSDGAIIQSSGFLAGGTSEKAIDSNENIRIANTQDDNNLASSETLPPQLNKQSLTSESVAKAIFKYVDESGKLIANLDAEDEVQLLRLRTKRQEIVIVPDQRYLMVVIQDATKTG